MSHSHIPLKHLLRQVEIYKSNRINRDIRPNWLTELIGRVAELFEPTSDLGRVGFDCQLAEECWIVAMFLGGTEVVGGKNDGSTRHANFQMDLTQLSQCFTTTTRLYWQAFRETDQTDESATGSLLVAEGQIGEHSVRLNIHSIPPAKAGPGMRVYPDGHYDVV